MASLQQPIYDACPTSSSSNRRTAQNIDTSAVLALCQSRITDLSTSLCVPESLAEGLLQQSQWYVDDAVEKYFQTTAGPVAEANDRAWKAIPSGESVSCVLCFESGGTGTSFESDCGSAVCTECWRGYISEKLSSGASFVVCPMPDCKAVVTLEIVRYVLSEARPSNRQSCGSLSSFPCDHDPAKGCGSNCGARISAAKRTPQSTSFDSTDHLVQAYDQLSARDAYYSRKMADDKLLSLYCSRRAWDFVKQSPNLARCPKDYCQGIIERLDEKERAPRCENCDSSFCWLCRVEYHWPLSCENAVMWTERGRNKFNDNLSLGWLMNNTKRCPNCGVAYAKDTGCDHVQCLLCNKTWNWSFGEGLGREWDEWEIELAKIDMPKGREGDVLASERNATALSRLSVAASNQMIANGEACGLDYATVTSILDMIKSVHRDLRWRWLVLYFQSNDDDSLDLATLIYAQLLDYLRDAEKEASTISRLLRSPILFDLKDMRIRRFASELELLRKIIQNVSSELFD